jgi:hypothetical protein
MAELNGLGKIWERSPIRKMPAKSHRISGPRVS